MATTPAVAVEKRAPARARYGPIDWMGGWKVCIFGCLAIVVVTAVHWWYTSRYAWTVGIDASTPEFTKYFRSLVWAELLIVGAGTGLWWGWLVRTGRHLIDQKVTPDEEVRRIAVFWGLVAMTSLTLYVMASFWPNQDGSWHQTAIRDTALTPSHIPMFYFWFPAGITMTIGTYLYGRRLYETMVYWESIEPQPDQAAVVDYTEIWQAADKVVYSTTLETARSARTRIEPTFDPGAVRAMKDAADRDLSIGGATLAAVALRAGLVDEVRVFVYPQIVGGGTRFLPDGLRAALSPEDEHRFANGVVYLRYRVG